MKRLLHLLPVLCCLPVLSHAQFACAGLDRVDIYVNGKLIATATPADAPTVKLDASSKSDTLLFHAYTSWEGLRNSTLDIKDDVGELIGHANSNNNNGYEAVLSYVLIREELDEAEAKNLDVFLNLLCERDVEPEQICTVSLNTVHH